MMAAPAAATVAATVLFGIGILDRLSKRYEDE